MNRIPQQRMTHLLRLYVSRGGGVSRYFSIVGIWARICFVISVHCDPVPKANGCGMEALKGVPSMIMELIWASSIIYLNRFHENNSFEQPKTNLILIPSKIPEL